MSFTYMASPYSHPELKVRRKRFKQACIAAGKLMLTGKVVFSPIAHSHSVEQYFDAIKDFEFWMAQDLPILRCASKLIVLKLDGWAESRGIAREMQVAHQCGFPVEFLDE